MSASSMNWVLKRMTLFDFLSLRRFHTRCLERGSDPAVGSSSSKICTAQKHIKSFLLPGKISLKKQHLFGDIAQYLIFHCNCSLAFSVYKLSLTEYNSFSAFNLILPVILVRFTWGSPKMAIPKVSFLFCPPLKFWARMSWIFSISKSCKTCCT